MVEEAIATLGIPGSVAVVILVVFAVLQLVGEFIELCGKVSPPFLKIRKLYTSRKKEKKEERATIEALKILLQDVSNHYSEDNIKKRNDWMTWVNSRAQLYDETIIEYGNTLKELTQALNNNTSMTERMFIESSRDRIIDFASKVANPNCFVSREEFTRIFKVYTKYEEFLVEHNMTNGEVEVNFQIIKDAYKERTEAHTFLEDNRK